jgi:hypothetical protein
MEYEMTDAKTLRTQIDRMMPDERYMKYRAWKKKRPLFPFRVTIEIEISRG